MKTIIQILALTFLVGCASHQTAELPVQIKEARQRYTTLFAAARSAPISRDEVHRILGVPQHTDATGVEWWSVQEGHWIAALGITFSPTGKIATIHDPGVGQFVVSQ